MNREFWLERWRRNEIGFHEPAPNRLLVKYFSHLRLAPNQRVFLPLCGKSLDIAWLLSQGHAVCGVDLSATAIEQLFAALGADPTITDHGDIQQYTSGSLDIFVGDIFALSPALVGPVAAIYDRAALVALPADLRRRYAATLCEISNTAPQLLICFEYDQSLMDGPPFSVVEAEVDALYGKAYRVTRLGREPVPGGLKGQCEATEVIWLLEKEPPSMASPDAQHRRR